MTSHNQLIRNAYKIAWLRTLPRETDTGTSAIDLLLAKFEHGSDITLRKEYSSQNDYICLQSISNDYWLSWKVSSTTNVIGDEHLRLGRIYLNNLYNAYNSTSAKVVRTGTWNTTSNVNWFGGKYSFSHVADNFVEFTSDPAVTSIGCLTLGGLGNTGIFKVAVDGDLSRATLLPSAQYLVDTGVLPASVLLPAGTLNPTDRLWDLYTVTTDVATLFVSDLSPASHLVRLTLTGYKNPVSTDTYGTFLTFINWGANRYAPMPTLFWLYPISGFATATANPVFEISYHFKPAGTLNYEWLGHTGSQKYLVLPTIKADGILQNLANGQTVMGEIITFDWQSSGRHTETGATNQATLIYNFTFDHVTGLTISHKITWLGNGAFDIGYPCMMTVDYPLFDRCRSIQNDIVYEMNGDLSADALNTRNTIWAWDYDGNLASLMYIPDLSLTVNRWRESGDYPFWMFDANGTTFSKVYARRFGNITNYIAGQSYQSECNYRWQYFPTGADATCKVI